MKKVFGIAAVVIAGISLCLASGGCSSGPRCYGNSVYDNTIYYFEGASGNPAGRVSQVRSLFRDGEQDSVTEYSRSLYTITH